jgi:hypothetical protein
MNVNVIGVKYAGKNKIGDFDWMISQPEYNNAIFLYCDTDDCFFSLRQKKQGAFPIPVCSEENGCFSCLNIYNKLIINMAFNNLIIAIREKNIETVFYSFDDDNNFNFRVLHEHPFVDMSVITYIMTKINALSCKSIKLMIQKKPKFAL